jgi:WD40 repeat protein
MPAREERTSPIPQPSEPEVVSVQQDRTQALVFPEIDPGRPTPRPEVPGYEILDELGRGGMGVVYKARQTGLQRLVALKMILAGAHATTDERARFVAEARAVARLHHPNIVQIYDVGEIDGRPYFALEYVGGGNLAQKLDGTPMPARQAAALASTLAGAMQSAHEQGIVHRDLKPANVLLTDKGMPKITDFGLAKDVGGPEGQTRSGAILGTPSYMAPEQALGRAGEIGPHTDVYALGAILYEMLTGRPPIRGETPMDTMMLSVSQEPVAPTQLQPKVPRDLDLICMKCLSKEPRKRLTSAAQLATELRHYLKGEPLQFTRPVGRLERTWRWCNRNPLTAFMMLAFALSMMLGTVLSSYGAIKSYITAKRAERLKEQAEAATALADAKAVEAEVNARRADTERFEAQLLSAGLSLNRGQELCEKGDVNRGMLWMTQSLRLLPQSAADAGGRQRAANLERVIRTNLAGWVPELNPLRASMEHSAWVNSAAFSPDGTSIVTASDDKTARIWDARSGAAIGTPIPHPHYVSGARFSPDSKLVLLAGWDGTARLWDVATRKPVGEPIKHNNRILVFAFSQSGHLAATGSVDGVLRLINTTTGALIGEALQHRGFTCMTFSPDGQTLATGGLDGFARFWDSATAKPKDSPLEHKNGLMSIAYHPEGKLLLTGGVDGAGRLWDLAGRKPAGPPPLQHQGWLSSIAYAPDGRRIVTGGADSTARLWDTATGQMVGVPMQHRGAVRSVAFSPDGKSVATASADSTARLWMASSGRMLGSWLTHQGEVVSVAFHPDGRSVLTGSHDKSARLWQLDSYRNRPGLLMESVVVGLAFSADGKKFVMAGSRKSPRVWDVQGEKLVEQPMANPLLSYTVAIDPQSRRFATGHAFEARIWELGKAQPLKSLPHQRTVYAAAFSTDGRVLATGAEDGIVRFFDVESGALREKAITHPDIVYAVAFHPNGKVLATGCEDASIRFWDPNTLQPVGSPIKHPGGIKTLAYSRDGRILVSGCMDGAVRSWDTGTGNPAGPPLMHSSEVWSVAITADGSTVLAGSTDGTARLWDRVSGRPLGRPFLHFNSVNAVALDPQGKTAATGGRDVVVQLWKVPAPVDGGLDRLTTWVQALAGMSLNDEGVVQSLTAAEWDERQKSLQKMGGAPKGR